MLRRWVWPPGMTFLNPFIHSLCTKWPLNSHKQSGPITQSGNIARFGNILPTWAICIPGGVLNFGLGRGVPLGILKCHHPSPIHVPILKEKWPIHVPRYMRSGPSMYHGVQFLTTHTCTCWKNSPMKVPE